MIAVGREEPGGFVVQPLLHHGAAEVGPQTAFGLEIKAEFVCGLERGLGRTPRMKAHSVQPVFLQVWMIFFQDATSVAG